MIGDILRDSYDGCSPLSPSSENVDALNPHVKMKASCTWRWYFLWSDCGNKLGPLWMTHTHASDRLFRWSSNTTLYWTVSLISVGYAWHFLTSLGLFCFINGKKKMALLLFNKLFHFWRTSTWLLLLGWTRFFWSFFVYLFVFVFLIFSADDDGITWSLLFYFMRLLKEDVMLWRLPLTRLFYPACFCGLSCDWLLNPGCFLFWKTEKTKTPGTYIKNHPALGEALHFRLRDTIRFKTVPCVLSRLFQTLSCTSQRKCWLAVADVSEKWQMFR